MASKNMLESALDNYLVENGYFAMITGYKPFKARWYMAVSKMARIRIRATAQVCRTIDMNESVLIWNEYARMMQRACRLYGYVMLRGYRAFHRETHGSEN